VASSNRAAGSSPTAPADRQIRQIVAGSLHTSGRSTSAVREKTKEQFYAEATARVAQELAMHRQKWAET